jgi:hypothetical protein
MVDFPIDLVPGPPLIEDAVPDGLAIDYYWWFSGPPYIILGSTLLFEIDATITSRARAFLARSVTDGTAIQMIAFSVGAGGLEPFNYRAAVPVSPDAVDLEVPLVPPITKALTWYERPNPESGCCYCVVDFAEANDLLSEIAIWGTVLWSPYLSEIGTTFCAAIAHFPLVVKTNSMRYGFRVNVQF